MKIRGWLWLVGFLALLALPAGAQTVPMKIKVQSDLVNISVNDYWDMPGNALHRLIAALKDYPSAHRFRLSFSLLVFDNYMETTVLYDRRKHSLVLYSTGSGDVLGRYCDHVRFTYVREGAFQKIADAHRNDYQENAWASLGDLPKYGCRRSDLGSRYLSPQAPKHVSGQAWRRRRGGRCRRRR